MENDTITQRQPPRLPLAQPGQDWADRHNKACANPTPREASILLLYKAARHAFLFYGSDGYGNPNVATPMLEAARAVLNFESGRFDCGTIDGHLCDMLEALGVEA